MLGGADNPNGELLSYIIGADRWLMIYWQGKEIPGNETYFTSDTGSGCRHGTG